MKTAVRERRYLGVMPWLLFGVAVIFFRLLEGLWLGFANEHFDYDATAVLEVVLALVSWAFLPRAKSYPWIGWPVLVWVCIFCLMPLSALISQSPVGPELYPLGWEGNAALLITLAAYAAQLALLVQCLRAKPAKQESEMPVL